jgi:hypothetical protein
MATSPEGVPQSELARAFRALFLAELGSVPHVEDLSDPYQLVIPPAHADVGELRIRDECDELTIYLGAHHHWHIPLYMFEDSPEDQRVNVAARAALESVGRVLEGSTILRLTYRGATVVSSTTYTPEQSMEPLSPSEVEFVWTGPRERSPAV